MSLGDTDVICFIKWLFFIALYRYTNKIPKFQVIYKSEVLYNQNVLKTTQTATSPFASHKLVASDHQCVRHPCRSFHPFSCSGGVAQLIILSWSGYKFQTENLSIKLQRWRSKVFSWYCGEHKSSKTSCNLSMPL